MCSVGFYCDCESAALCTPRIVGLSGVGWEEEGVLPRTTPICWQYPRPRRRFFFFRRTSLEDKVQKHEKRRRKKVVLWKGPRTRPYTCFLDWVLALSVWDPIVLIEVSSLSRAIQPPYPLPWHHLFPLADAFFFEAFFLLSASFAVLDEPLDICDYEEKRKKNAGSEWFFW